jgi:hypothetical protein
MAEKRKSSKQQVYTLVVQIGRKAGDGLPQDAKGAGLVVYASGIDEAEAVRETVAILKQADTAPLDVTGYGTLDERLADGQEIDDAERALMQRALDENAVIVAQVDPYFGDMPGSDDEKATL